MINKVNIEMEKIMKKLTKTSLAALSFSLLIGGFSKTISADSYCHGENGPYLFTISASGADFENNHGQKTLLLKDLRKYISYFDRTTHTSGSVSTAQFVHLWGQRAQSEGNEANGILNYQLEPQKTIGQLAVELSAPRYDSAKNTLAFHFSPANGFEKEFNKLYGASKNKNASVNGYVGLGVVGCFPSPQ